MRIVDLIQDAMKTQRALVDATSSRSSYNARELAKRRKEFQSIMMLIGIEYQKKSTELSTESSLDLLRQRHREIQVELSNHQSEWLFRRIDDDWDGYQKTKNELWKSHTEYFEWSLDYLSKN